MSKELEYLKQIKDFVVDGKSLSLEVEEKGFDEIECALKDYEHLKDVRYIICGGRMSDKSAKVDALIKLKALEIIKEKHVDCFKLIAIFMTSNDIEHYNQNYGSDWQLTKKEYDLLKEVLL